MEKSLTIWWERNTEGKIRYVKVEKGWAKWVQGAESHMGREGREGWDEGEREERK